MPYNTEDITTPFWAEYSSEASGRDPLAIQNSSIVIYTKMIVGITNVTNRIRYNGFYCWIFDTIAQNISKNNSLFEQIRYSRRAELLLAYIMVKNFPNTTGVSGSAYATKHIKSKMSLKNGADWESKKEDGPGLYWKFKSGVFGQYYSGVVRELNLINHPQGDLNIYTLTTKGHVLAKAYSQNIPKKERELFLQSVFDGSVEKVDLLNLKSFALHIIPEGTAERTFYESIILSHDDKKTEPTFNRRNTIQLLLKYLNRQKEGVENLPTAFLRDNYSNHTLLNKIDCDTATTWYLFEINELLHVAFEHFHVSFLYSIETYPTPIEDCINSLVKATIKRFKDEKLDAKTLKIDGLAKIISKEKGDIYGCYAAMELAFKKNEFGVCLYNAIKTILSVYLNSKHHLSALKEYSFLPENNFNRTGYANEIIEDLIETKLELTIEEYIKSVLLLAINLHTFSSYSKTKIGQSLVHNYMIEDNLVWRLRETLPNRTTPRLQNVIQYIIDIRWLTKDDKKYSITDSGINKIKSK